MNLQINDCTNVGVFAPVCSGKTFLMNEWLKTQNRFIRFDYTGETISQPGLEHFNSPKEMLLRLKDEDKGGEYFFRISYHPGRDVMEHYRWCQRAIWVLNSPRWFALDEFHKICPQKGTYLDPDVETLLRLARHNQMGVIGMSQRPQDINKLFIDSCRMCVIFHSQEENFLNACAGHWGNDVADAVENLRPLIYNDRTKQIKQVQQCCVVTRDGLPPRVYDFKTDSFVSVDNFLTGKSPEPEPETEPELEEEQEDGAFRGNKRESGAPNGELSDNPDDSDIETGFGI